MIFPKNVIFSQKNRKSVFAKSFRSQGVTFWQKEIFEIFGAHPPFPRKTMILDRNVTFGCSEDLKIGTSKCLPCRPRAPPCTKISRDPPTTIPRVPCNFGGDCGRSAREIHEKHVFGRVPPTLCRTRPEGAQNHKNRDISKSVHLIFMKLSGGSRNGIRHLQLNL